LSPPLPLTSLATTPLYTPPLHDALPILSPKRRQRRPRRPDPTGRRLEGSSGPKSGAKLAQELQEPARKAGQFGAAVRVSQRTEGRSLYRPRPGQYHRPGVFGLFQTRG